MNVSGNTARGGFGRDGLLFACLLVVAVGVRVVLASGDLWLDEIWSLSFARDITRPWDVLTAIHHDNNHPLNTLYLFAIVKAAGFHAPSIVYRLLSLVTGVVTIFLLFSTERSAPDGGARFRAWLSSILCAASFLGVVYSSEARGYAPAACCAVAAFAAVRRWPMTTGRQRAAFGALCTLGVLSHLTFLFVYAGLATWTLVRFTGPERWDWRRWTALHQIPLVAIAGVYLIDARKLTYGGGPPFRIADVVGRTLSGALGGPDVGGWYVAAAIGTLCAVVFGLAILVRERKDEALFFAVSLVAVPAVVLLSYKARFLDVRYFFVLLPFVWLLAARALDHIASAGIAGRTVAIALLVISIAGNALRLGPVLREGRGHYAATVATMASQTAGLEITVGSDNDFRNRMLLDFYAQDLPDGKALIYVPTIRQESEKPEWFLVHTFGLIRDERVVPREIHPVPSQSYELVRTFLYGGISGWNWHLYRRQGSGSFAQSVAPAER